jgi:hypothetical protein
MVVGKEDKRAFMIMVGISMSGEVLPFQVIYMGNSVNSLPKPNQPGSAYKTSNDEAKHLKFRFEHGGKKTLVQHENDEGLCYTCSHHLLQHQRTHLGHLNQVCLWVIDCWSVHHSQEFHDWMQDNYPWILIQYIPGGCTGIFQPCNVGIQCILKHTMWKTALSHIIKETVSHLDKDANPRTIMLEML